jgi:hypothetical protein
VPGEYEVSVELPAILPAGGHRVAIRLASPFETFLDDEVLAFRVLPHPEDRRESIERRRLVQPELSWSVARSAPRTLVP